MSEMSTAVPFQISAGQFRLIARKYGAFGKKSFADVGCGDGSFVRPLRRKGKQVSGLEERHNAPSSEDDVVTIGSPAAGVPWASHSLDCILFRGTRALSARAFDPEAMIALANLGSSLKPKGSLLIPVAGPEAPEAAHWQSQLQVFPGTQRIRTLKTGLLEKLTLAFLFRGIHQITVLEFRTLRQPTSRLDWHRLAREAVMQRLVPPAAA